MTHEKVAAPEAKALGDSEDVAIAFDGFMTAFEAFKETNDERLAQLEGSLSADIITREKVDRISQSDLGKPQANLSHLPGTST